MRRRPGIQGLQRGAQAREHYKVLGEQVNESRAEIMKAQLAVFKKNLEEFALKYRDEVRKNPVFRAQFHQMCAKAGVDPLASNKGMWTQLMGFGDFYYELGVQIIEAGLLTKRFNGGLLDLDALQKIVQRRRGSAAEPISRDDLVRAIKKLKELGGGLGVVSLGGKEYFRSVPGELNFDNNRVLELVDERQGYISEDELRSRTEWPEVRLEEALQGLLTQGLAMIDDGAPDGRRLYWFPFMAKMGD